MTGSEILRMIWLIAKAEPEDRDVLVEALYTLRRWDGRWSDFEVGTRLNGN